MFVIWKRIPVQSSMLRETDHKLSTKESKKFHSPNNSQNANIVLMRSTHIGSTIRYQPFTKESWVINNSWGHQQRVSFTPQKMQRCRQKGGPPETVDFLISGPLHIDRSASEKNNDTERFTHIAHWACHQQKQDANRGCQRAQVCWMTRSMKDTVTHNKKGISMQVASLRSISAPKCSKVKYKENE